MYLPVCPTTSRQQRGFSMIELMIAVTVGLFMVAAILVAYVASAENFRLQEAMSEVQEEGRFASIQMLRDFRETGFGMTDKVAGVRPVAGDVNALEARIQAQESKAKLSLIALNRIRSWVVYLPMQDSEGVAYYVATTTEDPTRLSLYRNQNPIAEGVTEFMLELGLDNDGDDLVDLYKNQYVMQAVDWDKARSIRFSLVLSSTLTNVVEDPQPLIWSFRAAPNNQVDTSDRRLYRMFVGTAAIRNALL